MTSVAKNSIRLKRTNQKTENDAVDKNREAEWR